MQPYAYENRQGIHPISWNDFHGLCKGLARAVSSFAPDVILAVGRGGYYPGTLISHILRVEIYPIRLSRRVRDVPAYQSPQWIVRPPELIQGQRVLIVDEICDTGETLEIVKHEAERMGAAAVRSAVLYSHRHGAHIPTYIGLITEELLMNPWDREIFQDGEFQFHPEYRQALVQQGIQADSSLLIPADTVQPAKGMIRLIIFDGGNTVIREPDFDGKMVDAPHLEAMPGITEALHKLQGYAITMASNANLSREDDIRRALRRIGVDDLFEHIFSSADMGVSKPDPAFFKIVLERCGCTADHAVMVGDTFGTDIVGAKQAGLRAIWYNYRRAQPPEGTTVRADAEIYDLAELEAAIASLGGLGTDHPSCP